MLMNLHFDLWEIRILIILNIIDFFHKLINFLIKFTIHLFSILNFNLMCMHKGSIKLPLQLSMMIFIVLFMFNLLFLFINFLNFILFNQNSLFWMNFHFDFFSNQFEFFGLFLHCYVAYQEEKKSYKCFFEGSFSDFDFHFLARFLSPESNKKNKKREQERHHANTLQKIEQLEFLFTD